MKQDEKKLEPIFSVSEYIDFLNINLRKIGAAKITGEVTKLTISSNGHVYFSIKDKSGNGVLDCIIWKYNYALCGVKLEEGKEVILSGYPDIYPPSGRLSFKADTVELKGEGALKKAYEELKNKLEKEGIFADERKRPIPDYVQNIGVITSKNGAVIHDFTTNVGKFGFKIKMIDSRVEGQKAVKDLLSSIKLFKKQKIEVLVIMRGGGSLESLMAFNNERLTKEVANFPVPVIAAIGHEKDIPLMSLAADAMTSTPTAAANLLSESWKKAQFKVERYERNIINLYSRQLFDTTSFLNEFVYKIQEEFSLILSEYKEIKNKFKIFLSRIQDGLLSKEREITNYSKLILKDFTSMLGTIKSKIKSMEKIMALNNPERQLRLGYSIARHNGKIIKTVKSVKIGEDMDVQVFDGLIQSNIKKINKK